MGEIEVMDQRSVLLAFSASAPGHSVFACHKRNTDKNVHTHGTLEASREERPADSLSILITHSETWAVSTSTGRNLDSMAMLQDCDASGGSHP